MKKYQNFLYENFHFLVVKFSVYLNRHVFVMSFISFISNADDTFVMHEKHNVQLA